MAFKPMLASAAKDIKFPVYASPKIDGIRACVKGDNILSRTLKPIPNKYIQEFFKSYPMNGMDGELVVGPANAQNTMQTTTSGVMRRDGAPDFTFYVFDIWTPPELPYTERLEILEDGFKTVSYLKGSTRVKLLPQTLIRDLDYLTRYESMMLEEGYEGIMVRAPGAPYKYGRSTAREGYLLKVKRFTDAEAVVIGIEELMHNENAPVTNALGLTERSSNVENKIPAGTLGALKVRDITTGIEFSIGTGFDAQERQRLWSIGSALSGVIVKYKHFEIGVKEAPRFPVYLGIRHPNDIGE